jgi:carbamoyltransferase
LLIIGVHNTGILSAAAALADGVVRFGCAEERLSRQKYSKYFPHRAIEACLAHLSATYDDVDAFAIGWNPALNIAERYRAGFSEWPAYPGERFYSNPNHLLPRLSPSNYLATEQVFHRDGGKPVRIVYVTHHLAHAAGAYLSSGFEDAAILTCDGYGERTTTAWFRAKDRRIELIREIRFPHSIGQFYSAVTQFLGFRPDHDEWKVMGAAAYGDPRPYYDALSRLIHYDETAEFELDLRYFRHFDFDAPTAYSPALSERLGPARHRDEPMEQRHFDISAALQRITEEYLFTAVHWLKKQADTPNLCLSGGVIMNSVFNGRVASEGPFANVHVPFAADDSGNAIGAALWLAAREGDRVSRVAAGNPFIGRDFDETLIKAQLAAAKIEARRPSDIVSATAELIEQGKIVGWFQGRMEFGQRALGARSILADPRDAAMKDRINGAVKFREGFRPFAPAVLAEEAANWFVMPRPIAAPYMEKVLPVRPEKRSMIPAVVHADGSGRLQTVTKELNPLFHKLITAFGKRTNVPIVLNTSFNINDEPIVESPADAIRTFYSSGLDALAIGPFLLLK